MKITMITGAGRGIGLSIAEKFYSENHKLILLVKNQAQKKNLEKKFDKNRTKIFFGDLAKYEYIKKISNSISYIDNLINNAATRNDDHLHNVKKREFDYLIDLNFKSTFLLTQIFTKKMIKRKIKGTVINLSSQLGHIGAYNRTAYCSSKFAIEGFTKAAALDLGKYGIRINTLAPTKTIVNQKELVLTKKRLNVIKHKIPTNEFTKKEDIAELCYFLTTATCQNITGSSIKIDGGWTAGK
jgi:NAD(P)-dependent dehydrogenase (short-subunit alcohol dehydrogenase family)